MSKYDYTAIGTKFKKYFPNHPERIHTITQGQEFAQKYVFHMIKDIEWVNNYQIAIWLEFHLKENFDNDINDFEEFITLLMRQAKKSYWNKHEKEKIPTIKEWIDRKKTETNIQSLGIRKIHCNCQPHDLTVILGNFSKLTCRNSSKIILHIYEGTLKDLVFTLFSFEKYDHGEIRPFKARWNESKNLLIVLLKLLSDNHYFKTGQLDNIKSIIRSTFGGKGLSDSSFHRYWNSKPDHEKAKDELNSLIELKYLVKKINTAKY